MKNIDAGLGCSSFLSGGLGDEGKRTWRTFRAFIMPLRKLKPPFQVHFRFDSLVFHWRELVKGESSNKVLEI